MAEKLTNGQQRYLESEVSRVLKIGDAAVLGQAIYDLSSDLGANVISAIERQLRELDSRIYILGLPVDEEFSSKYRTFMPHERDKEYPFYLWIAGGREKAEEILKEHGITREQNAANLENTGLIALK